jgi:hypothetical protein
MFQIVRTNTSGLREVLDLHELPIAGTMAHKLDGPSLYSELVKIGCPNISPTDGWQQLQFPTVATYSKRDAMRLRGGGRTRCAVIEDDDDDDLDAALDAALRGPSAFWLAAWDDQFAECWARRKILASKMERAQANGTHRHLHDRSKEILAEFDAELERLCRELVSAYNEPRTEHETYSRHN